MGQRIAEGDIQINVNDERALADLRRVDAAFDRTMENIDRTTAEASVGVDLKRLKADLKEAERDLKEFERRRKDKSLTSDERTYAQQRVQQLKAITNARQGEVKAAQQALDREKQLSQQLKVRQQIEDALEKRARARAKVLEQAQRRDLQMVNQQARAQMALDRQRQKAIEDQQRAMDRTHGMALREERDRDRALVKQQREIDNIPRMKRQYAELAIQIEKLDKARRKATDEKVQTVIDFKVAEAAAKMKALHATLERLGSPVTLEVNLHPGRAAGAALRNWLAGNQGGGLSILAAAASDLGRKTGESFVGGFNKARDRGFRNTAKDIGRMGLDKGLDVGKSGLQRVGNFMQGISTATVRLGPFTTSIRGLIGILGVLGPSILDVVGALGSMVSVAGAAALGAGALGVAFAGGAIPAVIGFMGVIKPMIAEFKSAKKASDAYQAAVLKYGENSKQAKKAQEQLQQTLKGTDASTVAAFKSASTLGARWKDLTSPARAAGFNVIGDAISFASKNMGWFARSTNDGFKSASDGMRDWIRGLGSGEGKNILGTMMKNFNASITPALHGLGQIATYLGRIGASASRFLPIAAQGFDTWASKLAASVSDGAKLDGTMQRLMDSAKSVGQFFMAAGRFLVSFFNPGVEAGERLTDTMTNALNRWTAINRSTQGKNNLAQFFQQSVTGAQNLYAAFAPLITSFVRWAALMAPAVSGFLRGAAAVSRFASGIANLLQLQGGVSTLAATLGALWAVGRISAATRAVMGFAGALGGVRKAQTVAAGADVAGALAGGLTKGSPLIAAGAGASKARGEITLLRRAAILAVPAIAGMGEVAAAASTGGLAILAGAAVYGGYKLLTMKSASDKFRQSVANSLKPLDQYNKGVVASASAAVQVGTAQRDYTVALAHVAAYKAKLNRLESEGKKNTDEYRMTVGQLNQALAERQRTEQSLTSARRAMTASQNAQVSASNELVKVEQNLTAAQKEHKKWAEIVAKTNTPESKQRLRDATKDLTVAQQAYNEKLKAQQAAAMQASINAINYQRVVKGLVPAADAAAQALGRLYRRNSKLATTIAVKYQDPKDAGAVASRANSALKAGVSQKIVTRIVADSSNADQAIRRLQAQTRSLTAKSYLVHMGINDEASAKIAGIIKRVNSMPEGHAKVRAIDNATTTIARIISRITGIPDKQARLLARDLITGKARQAKQAVDAIPSKTVRLGVNANLTPLQQALRLMGSLNNKTVTLTTIQNVVKNNRDSNRKAAGRSRGGREDAWVGEGTNWQGAKELIADHKTGAIMAVNKPTLMSLAPSQSVIPVEEPQHRSRGRELMAEFAKDMGFDRFSSGRTKKAKKKPTTVDKPTSRYKKASLSDYGQAQARKKARGVAGKNSSFDPDTMPELKAVTAAKKLEDNRGREASIAESKLKEPESFLIQTGTDANGDPVYDIDQSAINKWSADLSSIGTLYQKVMDAIDTVIKTVAKAISALDTVEKTAEGNISRIGGKGGPLERDQSIANGKGVSKSRRQAAQERIGIYQEYLKNEHGVLSGAQGAENDMIDERTDANYRKQEAQVTRDQYNTDSAAVAGKAAADKASSNPKPQEPDAPPTPPTALDLANTAVDALQANDALAAIGQGVVTSDADKVAAYQNVIKAAQAMLTDSDASNDSSAYSAITSAAGSIAEINGAQAQTQQQGYQNNMASSTARQDLFSSFANNFSMAGALGVNTRMSGFGGPGAYGQNAAAGGVASGVTNVVVNNSFPTPPADPHTWSQGLAFELQAAL